MVAAYYLTKSASSVGIFLTHMVFAQKTFEKTSLGGEQQDGDERKESVFRAWDVRAYVCSNFLI